METTKEFTSKYLADGNKIIADFLGWKYITFNDLQGFPKPGWWKIYPNLNVRILSRSPKMMGKKIIVNEMAVEYECRSHNELQFHRDWNKIMYIIQQIEKVDLKKYHYQWEMGGELHNNFEGFEFTLYHGGVYSEINLALDPPMEIAKSFDASWIENVWVTIVETIKYINNVTNHKPYDERDWAKLTKPFNGKNINNVRRENNDENGTSGPGEKIQG